MILLIKLLDPKKVNWTGKSYCMRFFFCRVYLDSLEYTTALKCQHEGFC